MVRGLKRVLPKPTACLRADEEAAYRETFPDEAHALTKLLKEGLERNPDAGEAVVHFMRAHEVREGRYVAMDLRASDDAVSRVLRRVCERRVAAPFQKRALVHTYHVDSMSYEVEDRKDRQDRPDDRKDGKDRKEDRRDRLPTRVSCWDERCCELDVRPGWALSYLCREPARPWAFPSVAEVHHSERSERLRVEMSGGVHLQVDVLGEDESRVCVVARRTDYRFPYRAVCRALTCLLAAGSGLPGQVGPPPGQGDPLV